MLHNIAHTADLLPQ